jgi:hypothetical protein
MCGTRRPSTRFDEEIKRRLVARDHEALAFFNSTVLGSISMTSIIIGEVS